MCHKQNVHKHSLEFVEKQAALYEPVPATFTSADATSLFEDKKGERRGRGKGRGECWCWESLPKQHVVASVYGLKCWRAVHHTHQGVLDTLHEFTCVTQTNLTILCDPVVMPLLFSSLTLLTGAGSSPASKQPGGGGSSAVSPSAAAAASVSHSISEVDMAVDEEEDDDEPAAAAGAAGGGGGNDADSGPSGRLSGKAAGGGGKSSRWEEDEDEEEPQQHQARAGSKRADGSAAGGGDGGADAATPKKKARLSGPSVVGVGAVGFQLDDFDAESLLAGVNQELELLDAAEQQQQDRGGGGAAGAAAAAGGGSSGMAISGGSSGGGGGGGGSRASVGGILKKSGTTPTSSKCKKVRVRWPDLSDQQEEQQQAQAGFRIAAQVRPVSGCQGLGRREGGSGTAWLGWKSGVDCVHAFMFAAAQCLCHLSAHITHERSTAVHCVGRCMQPVSEPATKPSCCVVVWFWLWGLLLWFGVAWRVVA